MGLAPSTEEKLQFREAVGAHIYEAMERNGALPDVGIDRSLLDNSGLASRAAMQDYFKQLKKHVDGKAPAYLKELMGKLASFTDEPKITGLLTLVIFMVIETAYASSRRSPQGAVAAATAEERLSELQNLMEEYLKRHRMHLSDVRKLREDTERLEAQVSFQLTQIKNAMLRDGHMSSRTLKYWVNGVAFHVQMLIHLARLDRQGGEAVRAAISTYQEDLLELLPKYQQYKAATIDISKRRELRMVEDMSVEGSVTGYSVHDKELGKSVSVPLPDDTPPACTLLDTSFCTQAYLEHMITHHGQIAEIKAYLSETLGNLHALIDQNNDYPPPTSSS
ncbi:uncharacterized protein LOC118790201 [Megalops cyprinoides]|uniref:uncharacterized protein LOC118790201 n=1 Tax=Megalops cyprinoides TaxID=118141 RepID=UPI001863D13D|nr:uncharacterized protein LOC118790201 [Megalops cyprinoides]